MRFFNTGSKLKPWADWGFEDGNKFNLDDPKVPWPVFRDWTSEAAQLSKTIVRCKNQIIREERQLDLRGGRAANPQKLEFNYTSVFQECVNAERLY